MQCGSCVVQGLLTFRTDRNTAVTIFVALCMGLTIHKFT